ncbi:MAG: adenosylcobinamide amidohydrolase [Marinobacter sp.]|uniref:adenosylcobinamide amidohydrolase n=1 Tax=Marinobacter sp. TaxID=50741 RepID=UPI00299DDB26|nr:adenosylcobinamide amidohydrolase [Marinobacter sp.]MDX1757046.1 adenosylcobinamide amidohydrolase [Marinobacter sp.]
MQELELPGREEVAGIKVCHTDRHVSLSWNGVRPCLSSAPHNGGYCLANRVLNLRVEGSEVIQPPEQSLQQYADNQGWDGETVGLMTAAPMSSLHCLSDQYSGESLALWVTCGLDNARRAGDPADWAGEVTPPPGTINTVFATSLGLSPATMAELLMVLTEAKCAVLQEAGVTSPVSGGIATGTGTDAIAIVSGHGRSERWAGKHTLLGERAAKLMMRALGDRLESLR